MYRYKDVAHLQPRTLLQRPETSSHVPMWLRIFHIDTIYWVQARIIPDLMWVTLLEHLLVGVSHKIGAPLPLDPYEYTYFNMDVGELLGPIDPVAAALGDEILFIHKSEFRNARDQWRRSRLIADMLRNERLKVQHRRVSLV